MTNGIDEPQAPAKPGDGFHDACRAIFLSELPASARGRKAWRIDCRPGPRDGRTKITRKAGTSGKVREHQKIKDKETSMTPVAAAPPAIRLTERINRIEPSATMAVVAEADKLRQQGIDVVDFGAGEPHFSTPQHVKDAAISAIQNNFSKYTAVGGPPELRDAIVRRHTADFGSDYRREECMASVRGT